MGRNVEIKTRVADIAALERTVTAIGAGHGSIVIQEDTFFSCSSGRLKLRRFSAADGELIFYERSDIPGPKASEYLRTPTQDPDGLRVILSRTLGVVGIVRKKRVLYLHGQTRIHLDSVEGLGDFLELEVVLDPEQSIEQGIAIARGFMRTLQVADDALEPRAYVDLLTAANAA
ncbi:MAG TPA: class IV adenylate cyclase [bacterium]|nr:class IV adenylate cyclase [bacterium]